MKTMGKVMLLLFISLIIWGGVVYPGDFQEASTQTDTGFPEGEWGDMEEDRLTGRDFVKLGERRMVEGQLFYEDDEWFLQTEEMVYEVHMGDHDYREKIGLLLEDGQEASIYGFIYHDDMAVISITVEKETYLLRTEEGTPLWGAFGGEQGEALMQRLERQEQLERIMEYQRMQDQLEQQEQEEQLEKEESSS